jgi:hypothetical protein
LTLGAVVSVDPVTATLPVAPGSVHSGVPPPCGAAVGHVPAAVAVSVVDAVLTSTVEDVSADDVRADDVSVSEPHAVTIRMKDAAHPANATEEDIREKFTVAHATAVHEIDEFVLPLRSI